MRAIFFEAFMHAWLDFLQRNRASSLVQEAMLAFSGRAQLAGRDIDDAIGKTQFDAVVRLDFRKDVDGIAIADHRLILGFDCQYRADYAVRFEFRVICTDLIKEVDAGFLEPTDVIRMVDDFHLICFIVLGDVDIGFQFIFQKSSSLRQFIRDMKDLSLMNCLFSCR